MLEESLPAAIWATMNSWFTPTVLFIFLNLMIGTIAIASGLGNQNKPHYQENQQQNEEHKRHPQLVRTPSTLERIKSFKFSKFRSEDLNPFPSITTTILNPPPEPETHQIKQLRVPFITQEDEDEDEEEEVPKEEKEDVVNEKTLDEIYHHHVERTKSDTIPASGDIPVKLSKKMKKSASTKSAFSHFEEEDIVQVQVRPSTVKEGKKKSSDLQTFGDDEEVDAKADDFINNFRKQLKLQRLDSILRYKETLNRDSK